MAHTNIYTTASPNGEIIDTIYLDSGRIYHSIVFGSTQILAASVLGIKTTEADFYDSVTFVSTETTTWNESYTMPAGKKSVCSKRKSYFDDSYPRL